tara:strand:+ start:1940 stop:2164 length:225 start_codon:yes stop_codon:yes gene_type:complete
MIKNNQVLCICDNCDNDFVAKKADRDRGWARCCSKACAAKKREKKIQKLAYCAFETDDSEYEPHPFSSEGLGQD